MPDPLSITAGIAGFLSLGISVTQSLIDFYSAYKTQDAELAKLTQKIKILQNTFQSLEPAIQPHRSRVSGEGLLEDVENASQTCQGIIKELQQECQKFHAEPATGFRGSVRLARRRVAYPFRESTIRKIEEDIDEIRDSLSLTLDVLQLRSQIQIEDDMSEAKSLLVGVKMNQISLSIRAWLMPPDASVNHNTNYAKRHPNTGLWLINDHRFTNWLTEGDSFLWLNGFAGCGKSVLCSVAIEYVFRDQCKDGVGIAYFYFSFTDETKQDDKGLLRALLLQLSVQFQDGEAELDHFRKLSKISTPSTEALLQTLRRFLKQFRDIYILVDALDECPRGHGRKDVLRVIQEIRDWNLPGVHFLVTSRDLLDIREALDPTYQEHISIKNSGILEDISDFVSYQLENDKKLKKWGARHAEIRDKLIQGSQGVFKYVECQLASFRRVRNLNQLDECLRSLPRDLDETYERILCEVDEADAEDLRRILTILCSSIRPLTVRELIEAHAVELGESPHLDREGRSFEPGDILDICLGLVEFVATGNEDGELDLTVRIAHFSVQEYLQSDRIRKRKAQKYAILDESACTEMTQICLAYLLDPTLSTGTLDEMKLQEFPLAHFAARYWFHYYQRSQAEEGHWKADKLLLEIFEENLNSFATWVKLHDIDRPWDTRVHLEYQIDDVAPPLYYAAQLGLMTVLKKLLLTPPSNGNLSIVINAIGGEFGNALQAAALGGHQEVVQILLDRGADVNAQGGRFGNALAAAALGGHQEVVQILLDRGADVNAQGGRFSNPLAAAALGGHQEVVQILLDRGADVNAQGGEYGNALLAAAFGGHQEVVRILHDRGADVNAQGGRFGNALAAAALGGHQEVVRILLDRGADVNAQGGRFGNALAAAALGGHQEVVQILLDRGADVNAQGGEYGNALLAAAFGGHQEVVRILLDRGANVNGQSGDYGNVLLAAVLSGHQEVVRILLDRGADVNAQGGDYGNALQAAVSLGHQEVAQMLRDIIINTEFMYLKGCR
ncbi:NACHT nucleoside triphosphatase [Penicillium longicatenatum]|uniref:NACHT nucleoside triphosphatase n=1 Tax=Penicillium longicatenatum TaxID=1561947 RepID=UPI00254778E2|nr:NACHT nucleoside triphosphatase [Penicillium longicatenatum]KAJ5631612.1 NACHT nucleoside triphosphatase [Penicillium longicatenatum]